MNENGNKILFLIPHSPIPNRNGNGAGSGRVAPIPTPPHLLKQFPSPIPAPPCLAFLFYFLFF